MGVRDGARNVWADDYKDNEEENKKHTTQSRELQSARSSWPTHVAKAQTALTVT